MSTVQSGIIDPKEQSAPIAQKGQGGFIEPRKQTEIVESGIKAEAIELIKLVGIIEPRIQTGTIDDRRRLETIEPRRQAETIEPRIQAGTIEPKRQAGTIKPKRQAGTNDPKTQAGSIDPKRQAGTIETRGQPETIETRRRTGTIETRGQPETIETRRRTGTIETRRRPVTLETRRQAGTIEPKRQAGTIEPRKQARTVESRIQDGTVERKGQAGTIEPKRHAITIEPRIQAGTIELRRQAGTIELVGQAGIIEHRRQSRITKRPEQARRSTDQVVMHKSKGYSARPKFSSGQSNSTRSPSHINDATNLKLSNFVDIQQLLNIGYRNPELLPLIKRISVVGEIFGNFNSQVQSELVALIKIVEKTVKEFVYMKSTAYNSEAVQETVYRLLPTLSKSFCHIVLKQGHFILDPAIRNLVEWKKISLKLSKKKILKNPRINLFDLSMCFQMKDLIEIGHEHPEFRTHIKTIFGVNAAMKHLNHGGQVSIYKNLRRIEKIIKDLVQEKTHPDGCHDIFLTPETLSSSLDYCIENILKYLKSTPVIQTECLQCETDRSYVRNVSIKPVLGTLKRSRAEEPVNLQPKQQTIFECANWGVSSDCINNLESLIHHIAAKKGVSEHAWLFESCVDWFEIASLFADYRSKTRQDMAGMQTLKLQILGELDQMGEVISDAKDFCGRMKNVAFTKNETLSDVIALSGQIEMLASEVDSYLTMLGLLIKELTRCKKEYATLSTTIRANRLLFLTRTQWKAFDFPFY